MENIFYAIKKQREVKNVQLFFRDEFTSIYKSKFSAYFCDAKRFSANEVEVYLAFEKLFPQGIIQPLKFITEEEGYVIEEENLEKIYKIIEENEKRGIKVSFTF